MEPTTAPTQPPKDDPIARAELAQFDGSDSSKPVYVAIKGLVFDVSPKREMYEPGKGYHIFAGKDGSKGLGSSSLKPEDAVADWSGLDDKQKKVLDDWVSSAGTKPQPQQVDGPSRSHLPTPPLDTGRLLHQALQHCGKDRGLGDHCPSRIYKTGLRACRW